MAKWTAKDALLLTIYGSLDPMFQLSENKDERWETFNALEPSFRTAILVMGMLSSYWFDRYDWLQNMRLIEKSAREEALDLLVEHRGRRDKQMPCWLYLVCKYAEEQGIAIKPFWIERLHTAVQMAFQGYEVPFMTDAQAWLSEYDARARSA